jgi:preprotein translocase subunit YajC
LNLLVLLAQSTPPTSQPVPEGLKMISQFGPILLLLVVFYLFMFRSKNTEKKKREGMLAALKKGDRVQTIGGIIGNVVEVRDGEVLVKVDESNNVKMRFIRSAIHRVVEEEKTESK